MKKLYRFIRRTLFAVGVILLFSSAGADEMYADWRQMPPESVGEMFRYGMLCIVPQLWHWLRKELRKAVR